MSKQRRKLTVLGRNTSAHLPELDDVMDRMRARMGPGHEPSCTRGCSACCRQIVSVSLAEAAAIVTTHRDVVAQVKGKLEDQDTVISQMHKEHGVKAGPWSELNVEAFVRLRADYWLLGRECPFLSEDKECQVYDVRPIACRGHFVISPPELCGQADGRAELQRLNLQEIETQAVAKLLKVENAMLGTSSVTTLATGVLHVFDRT